MESQMQHVWRNYIRELQQDPTYEIRKQQFLAQKKERATVVSEPLQDEDKAGETLPPQF